MINNLGTKIWRSGYTGIMGIDVASRVVLANATLAENHIGVLNMHLNGQVDTMDAVLDSTIIGSLVSH